MAPRSARPSPTTPSASRASTPPPRTADESPLCHGMTVPPTATWQRPRQARRFRRAYGSTASWRSRIGTTVAHPRQGPGRGRARDGRRRGATDPAASVQPGVLHGLRSPRAATPPRRSRRPWTLPILFEDADLLVMDKPAGLVVHPAPGNPDGTLVNALLAHCGDTCRASVARRRPGIVHRLDKDTSGVMVVAKSETGDGALGTAFATRDLERLPTWPCAGAYPSPAAGDIDGAIGRDPAGPQAHGGGVARRQGGTDALPRAAGVARPRWPWWNAAWRPGAPTRSACTSPPRAIPIVGDPVYLRRIPAAARHVPSRRGAAAGFPAPGAARRGARLPHPRTGAALRFETPPPPDFAALLRQLDAPARDVPQHSA